MFNRKMSLTASCIKDIGVPRFNTTPSFWRETKKKKKREIQLLHIIKASLCTPQQPSFTDISPSSSLMGTHTYLPRKSDPAGLGGSVKLSL